MKNKSLFSRLLENKKLMVILSVLLAVMFWIITSDNMAKTITNVPIEAKLAEGVDSELSVFPKTIDNITVEVSGKRVLVESLKPEDINAYVDLSGINAPLTATFDIQVKNSNSGYEIENIEPKSVKLVIDREITKTVKVISDFKYSPEGYYVDNNLPQTIDITGPEGIVDRIRCAYVSGEVNSPNAETVTSTFTVKLYDTENVSSATDSNIISDDYLTTSIETVDVTFRFLQLDENVPFSINYTPTSVKLPDTYIKFSPATLTVAGPEALLTGDNATKSIPVDIGSLSQYKNQIYNLSYHISDVLPKGFVNKTEGVETVKLQLDFSSLSSDTFEVPGTNVKVTNLNSEYTYKTAGNYPVTVIGTKRAIDSLDAKNITITYDFQNKLPEEGTNYLDAKVSISINSSQLCWVYRATDTATLIVDKK